MRVPGLWACGPEVIGALWSGVGPCPFRSLSKGVEWWDVVMRGDTALAAKVAVEALPDVEARLGAEGAVFEGASGVVLERLPKSQRLSFGSRLLRDQWLELEKALEALGDDADRDVVIGYAARIQVLVARVFALVPSEELMVLWASTERWLRGPLERWGWACGVVRRLWGEGEVTPDRVWLVMNRIGMETAEARVWGLVVLRLMHGGPSVASHVMGRWLVQQIWGPRGLVGGEMDLRGDFWWLVGDVWAAEEALRGDPALRRSVGSLGSDLSALVLQDGVAIGAALALERWGRLVSAHGALQELVVSGEAEEPSEEKGFTKGELAYALALRSAHEALDARADSSGVLGFNPYRTLLMVVDQELAVLAADFVLSWRHSFNAGWSFEEPAGFVVAMEGFFAQVVARMEGKRVRREWRWLSPEAKYWFGSDASNVAVLPEARRVDWRIEEVLRPLIYAALTSMAAGLGIPKADRLCEQHLWVAEKVWRPGWPCFGIYRAVGVLFEVCPKGIRGPEVMSDWARGLSVSEEDLSGWLAVQPFDLGQLEAFRQLVVSGQAQLELLGSLPETLYARGHVKPAWLTAPLMGLVEPRVVKDPFD